MSKHLIILFGATGDLARLKLLPAINSLQQSHVLDDISVIAIGRKHLTTAEYWLYMAEVSDHPFTAQPLFENEYLALDFAAPDGFAPLWSKLRKLPASTNILCYMAVGPDVLEMCITQFSRPTATKLIRERRAGILVEKPFGENGATAKQLDQQLRHIFGEHIYHNDHYLHKQVLASLVELRRQTPQFNELLGSSHIRQVELVVSEKLDLGTRAGFFDGRGMVIDWFQSHILQILAGLGADINATNWSESKADFIRHLSPDPASITRGQYEGYADTEGVAPGSDTETFLSMQLTSSLPQWQDTGFTVICGKALATKLVQIELHFRDDTAAVPRYQKIRIDPPSALFSHDVVHGQEVETTIHCALTHRQAAFVSFAEIEAQWKVTEEVTGLLPGVPLQTYSKGTDYADLCANGWC